MLPKQTLKDLKMPISRMATFYRLIFEEWSKQRKKSKAEFDLGCEPRFNLGKEARLQTSRRRVLCNL